MTQRKTISELASFIGCDLAFAHDDALNGKIGIDKFRKILESVKTVPKKAVDRFNLTKNYGMDGDSLATDLENAIPREALIDLAIAAAQTLAIMPYKAKELTLMFCDDEEGFERLHIEAVRNRGGFANSCGPAYCILAERLGDFEKREEILSALTPINAINDIEAAQAKLKAAFKFSDSPKAAFDFVAKLMKNDLQEHPRLISELERAVSGDADASESFKSAFGSITPFSATELHSLRLEFHAEHVARLLDCDSDVASDVVQTAATIVGEAIFQKTRAVTNERQERGVVVLEYRNEADKKAAAAYSADFVGRRFPEIAAAILANSSKGKLAEWEVEPMTRKIKELIKADELKKKIEAQTRPSGDPNTPKKPSKI